MSERRKEIISIIEPQLSSDGGGLQWFRTINPANVVVTMPFFALEYFRSGETKVETPNPKPREVQNTSFYLYMIHGKYSLRIDNNTVNDVKAGELIALHTGKSTIMEEVFLPTHRKLEGFRLWLDQTKNFQPNKSISITPNHSTIMGKDYSVQIQVLAGKSQFDPINEKDIPKVNLLRIDVDKFSEFRWVAPIHHNVLVFVFQGRGYFGPYKVEKEVLVARHQVLIYGQGEAVIMRTEDTPLSLLIATGRIPIDSMD